MSSKIKFFILLVVLTACNDNLGLSSPINIHLDKEIENKISLLSNIDKVTKYQNIEIQDILKICADINKLHGSINLFDGSQQITKNADKCFAYLATKIKSDDKTFIIVSDLRNKPDIILAIKINEITFLDKILQDYDIHYSDSTKNIH